MRLTVFLSEQAMLAAHAEASQRYQVSRLAGISNNTEHSGHPISADFTGLLGEIGFAAMFNDCERDEEIYARSGSIDFTINGHNVEIKSSKHETAHLVIPAYEIEGKMTVKEYNHIYCLMIVNVEKRYVSFAGYTQRDKLIRDDRLQYFRGSKRQSFVMCQEELDQLDDITAHWMVVMLKGKGLDVRLTDSE